MAEVTITLKRVSSSEEHHCGVCGADFIPEEDSGCRSFTIGTGTQEFHSMMCGGCHSKWSHGATVKIRSTPPR
jgi:hypothetical protein